MCDFHYFGLIFAGQMHRLPQRLRSMLFEIFSNGRCPKGTRSVEKISNNVDFSLWGNRAITWEYFLTFSSETRIMKIRHSESGNPYNFLIIENWRKTSCRLAINVKYNFEFYFFFPKRRDKIKENFLRVVTRYTFSQLLASSSHCQQKKVQITTNVKN